MLNLIVFENVKQQVAMFDRLLKKSKKKRIY